MATTIALGVDATDPLVAMVAMGVTWAAGRWLSSKDLNAVRDYLPVLAMGLAVSLRALIALAEGDPVSFDDLLRGIAAGASATWVQSAARAPVKTVERRRDSEG